MVRARILLAAGLLIAPMLPIVGALGSLEPEFELEPEYEMVELIGKTPEWWTPAVRDAALEAGKAGLWYNPLTGEYVNPATAVVTIPYGAPDYLMIRPGALGLSHDEGFLCTYNFIYGGGTQIGSAGHCVSRNGEPMYILAAPGPTVPLITSLGTVASHQDAGVGNDWSLTTIAANWRQWVDPNMAYLGGPSCSAWSGGGGVVKHSGHGIQTGLVASVPRYSQANAVSGTLFEGIGQVSGGDSGSPMIQVQAVAGCSGGSAAGILTHCLGIAGLVCLPLYTATDIRSVPATVTVGLDPL